MNFAHLFLLLAPIVFSPPHYTTLKTRGFHWTERLMRAGRESLRLHIVKTGSKDVAFIPYLRWSIHGALYLPMKRGLVMSTRVTLTPGCNCVEGRREESGFLHCVLLYDTFYRTPLWEMDSVDTQFPWCLIRSYWLPAHNRGTPTRQIGLFPSLKGWWPVGECFSRTLHFYYPCCYIVITPLSLM